MQDTHSKGSRIERVPGHLYKYWGSSPERQEWLRTALIESRLYFPSRTTFNDPLDCRIPLNFDASDIVIQQFWTKWAKRSLLQENARERKERIARAIKRSRSPSGRQEAYNRISRTIDAHGILCLTTQPQSTLMWSYYANGHDGVALRLKMDPRQLLHINEQWLPIEVRYAHEIPEVKYYRTDREEMIDTIFGTKAAAWAHESEWRIVLVGRAGYLKMPPAMIDGVILGLKTSQDYEGKIREWIAQRSVRTELLRIRNRHGTFDLELIPA